jgi:formyltetrahydrofolate-dependent phosphoribosylglycinamide formyltransferase
VSRPRIAVLASGGGSNLQALVDHFRVLGEARAGDIVLVASNKIGAGALDRARAANIETGMIATARNPAGDPLGDLLTRHQIDIVVLAGYLQLIPPEVTRQFAGRMLNVHPAPLPAFGGPGMYGARVHRAVIAAGVSMSGPTVHFVDELYDHGATIAHWPVPVIAGDDEHTLAARVLRAEHLLFPRVVQSVAAATITRDDDRQVSLVQFDPSLNDTALGLLVDHALSRSLPLAERQDRTAFIADRAETSG